MKPTLNLNIINIMTGRNRKPENQEPVISPEIKAVFLRAMLRGKVIGKNKIRELSTGISLNLTAVCTRHFLRKGVIQSHKVKGTNHLKYSLVDRDKALELALHFEAKVKKSAASKAREFIAEQLKADGLVSRSDLIKNTDFTTSTIDQALIRLVSDDKLVKTKQGREAFYKSAF